MAKIENTTVYPIKSPPVGRDYFVITDVEDGNSTKNCLIGDLTSSLNIYETTVTVSSSYLSIIATNMFTLIPAVAGKYIVPISIISKLTFGTTAYNFGGSDLVLITTPGAGAGSVGVNSYGDIPAVIMNSAVDVSAGISGSYITPITPNEPLVLWGGNQFSNPSQGDSELTLNIQYRLVSI
tara:strand:- start:1971 stop:2513 length:543 start_codon:yes stop_codon:yes gene_type:complete